jgi:hypothetical protein
MKETTGCQEHNIWGRTPRHKKQWQDIHDSTAGTGHLGQDIRDRTVGTSQPGPVGMTDQQGEVSQDRMARPLQEETAGTEQ